GCGGEEAMAPATQHLPVRLKLVGAGCDAGRVGDFRGFDAILLAPRSERSACVTGRPQTFAAIDDALAGRIAFRDLPEGKLTLKLQGYRDEGCRADKLGMCGIAEAQLAPALMELEVPVACDDVGGPAFTACVGR
ncbi:MAG TPA: hypothetical protein VN914_12120, partial [Polyangia bacterium]|nr:hypothetical protein [Polyangia bacterium]